MTTTTTRLALCLRLLLYTLGVGIGVGIGVAHADTPAKTAATAAYREGQRHYAAGEYPAAAERFLAAFNADPDPVYLFNAAQAYRFANDCTAAATYYRRFLSAVVTAPNLDRVRANLAEMEACDKRTATPPLSPPSATAPTAPAPPPPSTDVDPGATKRRIGIGLGIAGLAAAAAGIWFQHNVGYFEKRVAGCVPADPCTAEQVDQWNSRGNRASLAAIASYSVAGAALITGSALYLLGRSNPGERTVAVAPTHGGAIITAAGAF